MVLDEKEFELFCNEIAKVALEQGIDYESITTILAKAIKNREDELTKQATQEVVERQLVYGPPPREEVVEVYQAPQLVYGPPPREEVVEVYQAPQLVYGPPPREEVVEVHTPQLVYGPPQREELIEMIEPPQLVYGPPPRKK